MASIAASLVVLLLVAPVVVYGTTHTVSWSLAGDYSGWSSKSIYVGDKIEFTYDGTHNVNVVSKEGYTSCSADGSSFSDSSGTTTYPLTTEGDVYFICASSGHCPPMQLHINVQAASTASNTTSPTTDSSTSTTTTSTTTPTPATPTSATKDNAATSRSFNWLVFGVSVVFATLLNVIC